MDLRRLNLENSLYALALLLALGLRLLHLGATPLNDQEASWALQALHFAHPAASTAGSLNGVEGPTAIGPNPAYVFLTGLTFAFAETNAFTARLWPALVGAFLVLLPAFWRDRLGRPAALILAFGLAIDPGLNAVARQAGGPMLAISFGMLAISAGYIRRPILAGALAGLALLSGSAILAGMLSLGLAWAIIRVSHPSITLPLDQDQRRRGLISLAITILLAGTFFLRHPQGLAAWASTLPAYLQGWYTPSGVLLLELFAALLVYECLPLLFALVALGKMLYQRLTGKPGAGDEAQRLSFILFWLAFSLALALLYPARQVTDLAWTLLPLWALAAGEMAYYLPHQSEEEEYIESPLYAPLSASLLEAGLMLILATLSWNTLIATSSQLPSTGVLEPLPGFSWDTVRLVFLLGILTLGTLITALITLGWSWPASRRGLAWGLGSALLVYSIAALWGAAYLRPNQPHELWSTPPATGQANLLLKDIQDISERSTGFVQQGEIVSTVDTPSLRWLLRDYPQARFVSELPAAGLDGKLPMMIITRQEQDAPALAASYRGQDFIWWIRPGWEGSLPQDKIAWLTFRDAPLANEKIILWARNELFDQ